MTASSTVAIPSLTVASHYSLNLGKVEGSDLSSSSMIFMLSLD